MIVPLAAALLLALPAVAGAAYAPKLAVEIDPSGPDTPVGLTTTVTQAQGEDASRTVQVVFPVGFVPPLTGVKLETCNASQIQAKACPAGSRMGSANASTGFGPFTGGVFFAGTEGAKIKIVAFISNGLSLLDQTLVGLVDPKPTGFETTFDNLPDVPVTSLTLALEGGDKSLLVTPVKCGTYEFAGRFTSQQGAKAESRAPVTVSGCPKIAPIVSDFSVKPVKRRSRSYVLRFETSKPARATVKLDGKEIAALDVGDATVKVPLGRLKRGRHKLEITAVDAEGASRTKTFTRTIR